MDRKQRMRWAGCPRGVESKPARSLRASGLVPTVVVLASAMLSLAVSPRSARAEAEPGDAWGPIEVGGHAIAPGETERFFVDLAGTTGYGSRMLDALVVVVRGTTPGPTLCLVAGIHGDELNGIEIAHRIYANTKAAELAGTLIAVPTVNMQGLRSGNRYLPDRRDLNRAFPGNPNGSLAARIAHTLFEGVIRRCGALIDLHTGSASRSNVPQIRTDLESPEALALAQNFGAGVILAGTGPSGSLRRAVLDAGVPAVIYEAGGPLQFEEPEIRRGVEGVKNVMASMGMTKKRRKVRRSEIYRKTTWVRSGDAMGVFLSDLEPGDRVGEGDVLGSVTDPVREITFEIVAPRKGRIIGMAVPQFVLPGYGLFNLGYDPE